MREVLCEGARDVARLLHACAPRLVLLLGRARLRTRAWLARVEGLDLVARAVLVAIVDAEAVEAAGHADVDLTQVVCIPLR